MRNEANIQPGARSPGRAARLQQLSSLAANLELNRAGRHIPHDRSWMAAQARGLAGLRAWP